MYKGPDFYVINPSPPKSESAPSLSEVLSETKINVYAYIYSIMHMECISV